MFMCNTESCELILDIKKKFACAINLKQFNWQKLITHLENLDYVNCCEHQTTLLKFTILHPIIQKYPIKKTYQKEFLKTFINKCENQNIEINDAVYESLLNILSSVNDEVHYRHFIIKDRFITLKENTCLISQGTTGLITWQAGIALANWIISNNNLLRNKQILELGCGIGLTGLAIIYSGVKPNSYLFTDCHPVVLEHLTSNINLNSSNNSFPKVIENTEVNVLKIDWNTIDLVKFNFENIDYILAADVIYDPLLTESFCKTLNYLIRNTNKQAIVACTERDPETIKSFKYFLVSHHLEITDEIYNTAISNLELLQYSSESIVIIYIIKELTN